MDSATFVERQLQRILAQTLIDVKLEESLEEVRASMAELDKMIADGKLKGEEVKGYVNLRGALLALEGDILERQ